MPARPPRPVSLAPILAVNFVATLGFSIVLPFLVFLVDRWGGNALVYGLMGATYSSFQLVGAPILGRWSDRYGRRKILLLSQLGTLVSWLIFLAALFVPVRNLVDIDSRWLGAFTLTLPLVIVFLARAADGLTGGNISVANAYLADVSSEDDRSANFGKMAVAANLGFILGPALAGLLGGSAYGELLPVCAAVLVSIIATGIIAFRLPEPQECKPLSVSASQSIPKVFGQEHKDCVEPPAPPLSIRGIMALGGVPFLLAIYFLVMLAFNFFYVAFPVHAVTRLAWTLRETGIFFSYLSLVMVLVQGPVLARASRRFGEQVLVVAGSATLACGFLFLVRGDKASIYTGAALIAFGNGLMWPSFLSVLSKVAGTTHQGAVQGLAGSAGAVASIIGLIVGGLAYAGLGGSVFIVSAAIVAVVFGMSMALPRAAAERPNSRSSASSRAPGED